MHPEPIDIAYDTDEESRELQFAEIVRATLLRELERRRDVEPHVQLGVPQNASEEEIDAAFRTLSASYDPQRFAPYGSQVRRLAGQLLMIVGHAHATLSGCAVPPAPAPEPAPPREEAIRARAHLQRLLARRLSEAERLEQEGKLREAAGVLESIVLTDRNHAEARARLAEVRLRIEDAGRGGLHRALRKLWSRSG